MQVARLIYEYGSDHAWKTEVVGMLRKDRSFLLSSNGGESDMGAAIVGRSLSAIVDEAPKKLFKYLAACPEDVNAPLPALELLW